MMPVLLALLGFQGAPRNPASPSAAASELWGLSCLLHSASSITTGAARGGQRGGGASPLLLPPGVTRALSSDLPSSPKQLSLFLSPGPSPLQKVGTGSAGGLASGGTADQGELGSEGWSLESLRIPGPGSSVRTREEERSGQLFLHWAGEGSTQFLRRDQLE